MSKVNNVGVDRNQIKFQKTPSVTTYVVPPSRRGAASLPSVEARWNIAARFTAYSDEVHKSNGYLLPAPLNTVYYILKTTKRIKIKATDLINSLSVALFFLIKAQINYAVYQFDFIVGQKSDFINQQIRRGVILMTGQNIVGAYI